MAHGVAISNQTPPTPPTQPRRVKVYELKNNDWFDRGTGYCTGHLMNEVPHIQVKSEEEQDRLLLETKIIKDDGYQKQQETLIVWTEPNGTDMALSFQEPEGCAAIWEFVSHVQNMGPGVMLPPPDLGNLADIENMIRAASSTSEGRDSLGKFVLNEDYISKIIPLLQVAEDLESLSDLHRLCNITKMIILLNDTVIIEHIVTDEVILGVVGMLEYDPDFPTHKANHRQWLSDTSKFKEVVRIEDPEVKKKIHWIYRLQYLKDVILARILDDPTYSVLNSLIFYHQVEVLQYIQNSQSFLMELFSLFATPDGDRERKKNAVSFIQQCCQIAKNLQALARSPLYQAFVRNGLFAVIDFAMQNEAASVRIAGMDIIMAMIDHDPQMMRTFVFNQRSEKQKPLTDTLIELLQGEKDFGVKAQIADAIKVLLDPQTVPQDFYEESAKKLFLPLIELEKRPSLTNLTITEVSLYSHLLEILWFFVRQHVFRSKYFIIAEDLPGKVIRLLESPEKHLKLGVVKLIRILIAMRDSHFERYLTQKNLLEPILDLVIETMPRDNLLNSACLEFFEFIRRETLKSFINDLVEHHREKLEKITYVDTFQNIILRYEQANEKPIPSSTQSSSTEDDRRPIVNGGSRRWSGVRDMDAAEEEYFNTSDDEDFDPIPTSKTLGVNGRGSAQQPQQQPTKPLVDYPDDEDMDNAIEVEMEMKTTPTTPTKSEASKQGPTTPTTTSTSPKSRSTSQHSSPSSVSSQEEVPPTVTSPLATAAPPATPPERLSEKRRREEEDDDELGKLSLRAKKRSPSQSGVGVLGARKRNTIMGTAGSPPTKKIAISLSSKKDASVTKEKEEATGTGTVTEENNTGNGDTNGSGNGNIKSE